jgi:ribosomal protein L11 methylase PrmA
MGMRLGASFRDPAAFVFTREGVVYRQVNEAGREDYDRLMSSGLYAKLTAAGDLVPHDEEDPAVGLDDRAVRVLRPERIAFISHPYEWCFSQLQDAALLTLRLQRTAMALGLSLKDATPYNVQFREGRPIWIDTLSFERWNPDEPWVAYRQFCEMLLAPLALMSRTDVSLHQLLRVFLDGVPAGVASKLLPLRTRLSPGLGVHIHLLAAASRRATATPPDGDGARQPRRRMARNALPALIDSLERTVRGLRWQPAGTVWGNYYDETNYTDAAFAHKRELVAAAIDRLRPSVVWDLGANDGTFSRVVAERNIPVVAFDVDPAAVEKNYRQVRERTERWILPLVMDLTNPSPACGWAGQERQSLAERGPADLALALALVHHLAIGHNVPLPQIAAFFASIARALVIEFVAKTDSQVQRMLATRKDVFSDYSEEAFVAALSEHFHIDEATPVRGAMRTLYSMRRRAVL